MEILRWGGELVNTLSGLFQGLAFSTGKIAASYIDWVAWWSWRSMYTLGTQEAHSRHTVGTQ